jgi:hypothetical protein
VKCRAGDFVAVALESLPKYLVLEPTSSVRIDMHLDTPACDIDVNLDNPRPGRSFVLLIGHPGGPFVQRVRLSGRARIHFDPETPGDYAMLFANPQHEPVVVRLKVHAIPSAPRARGPRRRRREAPPSRRKKRSKVVAKGGER